MILKEFYTLASFKDAHEYFKFIFNQKKIVPEIKDYPDINKLYVKQIKNNKVQK